MQHPRTARHVQHLTIESVRSVFGSWPRGLLAAGLIEPSQSPETGGNVFQKWPIRQLQTKKRITTVLAAGHSVTRRPAPTAPLVVGVIMSTAAKTSKLRIVAPHRTKVAECVTHPGPRIQPTKRVAARKQIATSAYASKGVGSPEPSIIVYSQSDGPYLSYD